MAAADMTNQPSTEWDFARACIVARARAGISQTELAQELAAHGVRIDGSAIARLENGRRNVRLNEAVAIARALGFPTVDAMVRPALPPDLELAAARGDELDAAWRAAQAVADHAAAVARVERLVADTTAGGE